MSTSSSGTEALGIAACTADIASPTTSIPSLVSIAASSVSAFWATILAAVWKRPLAPALSPGFVGLVVSALDLGNAMTLRATSALGGSFSDLGSGIALTGREGFGKAMALKACGLTALRMLLTSSCQRRRSLKSSINHSSLWINVFFLDCYHRCFLNDCLRFRCLIDLALLDYCLCDGKSI